MSEKRKGAKYLSMYVPVNSLCLVTVKTQRCGQVPGAPSNFIFFSFPRNEGLIHPRRAQEGYQSWTELLPKEGGEVCVSVNLLWQG